MSEQLSDDSSNTQGEAKHNEESSAAQIERSKPMSGKSISKKITEEAEFMSGEEEKELEIAAPGKELSPEDAEAIGQALKRGRPSAFFEVLETYFEVKDKQGITIVLAMAVAHQIPGEMIWMRVYGASRSGKTELLSAIASHRDSTEMEVITPASIRGGFKGGHKLLERLDGKLVVTKDLAAMAASKREARTEVFGLLRNVKDGRLIADYGTTEDAVRQLARFDWLIGTTPGFAQSRQMEDLLGARFVDLNWKTGDREQMALRAAQNNAEMPKIRAHFRKAVCELIDRAKMQLVPIRIDPSQLPVDQIAALSAIPQDRIHERLDILKQAPEPLSEDDIRLVSGWADLTAMLRSPVARDYQHHIKFHPEPEVGTDLAQTSTRLVQALKLMDIREWQSYIARLAQDCIPYDRRQVLRSLLDGGINAVNVPPQSTRAYLLEDMEALDIVHKASGRYQLVSRLDTRIRELVGYWQS